MTLLVILLIVLLSAAVAWGAYNLGFKNGTYRATSINNEHKKPFYGRPEEY